jgi:hypothetical protein
MEVGFKVNTRGSERHTEVRVSFHNWQKFVPIMKVRETERREEA